MRLGRVLACAAALVALLGVAACGIPSDESPRVISADNLPAELNPNVTTTTISCAAGQDCVSRDFYYVTADQETGTERLVVVERQVPRNADVGTVLRALLPRPEGTEVGTRIPQDVQLLDWEVNDAGTLVLTWSDELGAVENQGQRLAAAQIVHTAMQFPDVQAVQFFIADADGNVDEDSPGIPDQNGESKELVTTADYSDYAPA